MSAHLGQFEKILQFLHLEKSSSKYLFNVNWIIRAHRQSVLWGVPQSFRVFAAQFVDQFL